jgi:hypothetical protein
MISWKQAVSWKFVSISDYNRERSGSEVLTAVIMNSSVFWDITPCISLKVNQRFGEKWCLYRHGRRISQVRNWRENRWKVEQSACRNFGLHWELKLCLRTAFTLISCSTYSSALKMEVIRSSETLVDFQQITRRYCQKIELFMGRSELRSWISRLRKIFDILMSAIWYVVFVINQ